ncbi:hypothetical protein [Aestuariivirga litoralis]|uniref:hypothetical protein n=1 Tax=Aestuariivirga litoralis TaxID=2650924 RepID=UPI0018C7A7E8|nr:hypothetical protein [Aestuariivirga litoralis]MBG1233030.1 hypothetical protein [Aestuariivirga litoralis]
MERFLLVSVQAPTEDMERIAAAIGELTPLPLGKYDQNTFETATGLERYRPLEGAAAGAETDLRKRPGVATLNFQIPPDQPLLEKIVERIFQVHSYQEPVIIVQEVLASRSKGLDDKDNPHRWWNTTGDWKKKA